MYWVLIYICLILFCVGGRKKTSLEDTGYSKSNSGTEEEKKDGARWDKMSDGGREPVQKVPDGNPTAADGWMITVPFLNQENYPTGCESVTAVMALQYAGYEVTIDEFIDEYLRVGTYYEEDGEIYGNSPYYYFVGNPRTGSGYGCFAPVIYDALEKAAGKGSVVSLKGKELETITKMYVESNIPVILWATIDMCETYDGESWTLIESGEQYTWPAEEHCLLLVGFDQEYYYFNDPNYGDEVTRYERSLVEQRYLDMGSQALAILPASRQP